MRRNLIASITLVTAAAVGSAVSSARAAVTFNEIGYDMPGGDSGQEFVELRGTPGESLDGLTYLVVEGDGGGGGGVIEQSIPLTGLSIGSNGLLLIRDSSFPLNPAPAAGTTVFVNDFTPDIENNTSNHILVRNAVAASVTPLTDLDGPNGGTDDGVFDATPWDSVVDSFTVLENNGTEYSYVSTPGNVSPVASGFNPDFAVRLSDGRWVAVAANNGNASGDVGGPYSLSATGVDLRFFADGSTLLGSTLDNPQLTPGDANPSVVPEPATLALVGLAGLITGRRRRA